MGKKILYKIYVIERLVIQRNLALDPPRTKGDTAQSSQVPQNPPKSLKYTPTKARGSKGPQKSVANYVTAHTLLSSLTIYINISQMFHRHLTDFTQRLPIKNNRIYYIYNDMECLLPNGN